MLIELIEPYLLSFGYAFIFLIVFAESGLFFGFFLPGDSLLFTSGLLASQGLFDIRILLVGIFLAAVLGDQVGYYMGRYFGKRFFNRSDSFFRNPKHVERAEAFYDKHGQKTIVLARFVPAIRTFAPIVAGIGNMNHRTFTVYNLLGGLLWTLLLTLGGFFLGHSIPNAGDYLEIIIAVIVIVSLIPVALEFLNSKKEKSPLIVLFFLLTLLTLSGCTQNSPTVNQPVDSNVPNDSNFTTNQLNRPIGYSNGLDCQRQEDFMEKFPLAFSFSSKNLSVSKTITDRRFVSFGPLALCYANGFCQIGIQINPVNEFNSTDFDRSIDIHLLTPAAAQSQSNNASFTYYSIQPGRYFYTSENYRRYLGDSDFAKDSMYAKHYVQMIVPNSTSNTPITFAPIQQQCGNAFCDPTFDHVEEDAILPCWFEIKKSANGFDYSFDGEFSCDVQGIRFQDAPQKNSIESDRIVGTFQNLCVSGFR